MRATFFRPPPPNALERVIGRRRANRLRRRLGFVALGFGALLLRPRLRPSARVRAALALSVIALAVGLGAALPIR